MKVNRTGLAQTLGQICDSNRDFQSNCWANLRILGQPCAFQVPVAPAAAEQPSCEEDPASCDRSAAWHRLPSAPLATSEV